ncbi:MAG: bifunctional metallophosphatase/5'-nucleotidase [Chloroflexi bacterium]|nr:bifunctional metallophosphatase/5'-nucleotidase [Chloroflexota bacterium]
MRRGWRPPPAAAGEIKLTILHTNDTHGHLDAFRIAEFPDPVGGVARRATLVAQIRQETPNVLLVDGGDVHQGILMADTFKGEPDIQFMNTLGYDVMGLGNHDLDWGWATLQARQSAARFPIVNANLVISDTGKPALTPYVIKEVAGLKIAFTSLAGPDFRTLVKPENISGLRFADPIATAQALVPELRQQADLVVVLGHEMVNDDQALAAAVPGIDVIIGGHEHIRLNEAVRVGDTVLVEAWQFGAFVGRLDLTVRGGQVVAANYRLIPVANSIAPDPAIAAEVQLLVVQLKEQKPERFAVLGEALVDITDTNVRRQEAAIGNFATDVMRAAAQADVALSTSSSFLNSIFKGPITVNDLTEAMPYQNSLVTVRLTGAQVQQVLTVSAQNIGKGNFCQVSGVRFTIAGDQVTDIQVGGAPLDAARLYLVATTNYQGGIAAGYKDIFAAGQGYTDTGQDVGQLIVDYIQSHQQVGARVEGRITVQ